ncbi:hypothetical protein DM02DRAFT_675355 [Periconia macrospinosa]|uniref:C2H2-type domain-containing protein n=1 Tax=Periconia macrospinosa TaxID=97972 RepID=A0A2V1DCF4_9PLEO|nr:hypothetical protein DM02DRAFT_675355 [Periconia macrospinosa]
MNIIPARRSERTSPPDSGYKSDGSSQLSSEVAPSARYATRRPTSSSYSPSYRLSARSASPLPAAKFSPSVYRSDRSSRAPSHVVYPSYPMPPPPPTLPSISALSSLSPLSALSPLPSRVPTASSDSGYHSSYTPARSRNLNTHEEVVAWEFLEHGKHCDSCKDPMRTYRSCERLCSHGNLLAGQVDELLRISKEGKIQSIVDACYVNLGSQFEDLEKLLWTIDESTQDKAPFLQSAPRRGQIISSNRRSSTSHQPVIIEGKKDRQSKAYPMPTSKREHSYPDGKYTIVTVNSSSRKKSRPPKAFYEEMGRTGFSKRYIADSTYKRSSLENIRDDITKYEKPSVAPSRDLTPTAEDWFSSDDESIIAMKALRERTLDGPPIVRDYTTKYEELSVAKPHRDLDPKCEDHVSSDDESIIRREAPRMKSILKSPSVIVSDKKSKEVSFHEPKDESLVIEPPLDPSLIPVQSTELSPPPSLIVEEDPEPDSFSDQGLEDNRETQSISSVPSSSDIEAPEPEHVLGILSSAILQLKESLLRGIIDQATSEELTDGAEGSQKRARESTSPSSSQASDRPPHKRVRGKGRDPGDGGDGSGDDDDDSDPPKRNERRSPFGSSRRLKCPFYQREPEKYSRAACRGEGFADMAKLKDHIKRVHTQPLRCVRCWEDMPSEDAHVEHQQAETPCTKQPQPDDDRITQRTLKRLDFKKAPYAQAKDTEQKWRMMYKELFPNDPEAPSPYDQHGFTPRLEKVLYEALEEELTRELAPALEPILRRIKDRIPFIIQNCRQKLLRSSPDSIDTPNSVITVNSKGSGESSDSSSADFFRRREEETSSDSQAQNPKVSGRTRRLSTKAQGKRPQHYSSSPSAGSTTDEFRGAPHSSSPGSIVDSRATPPTPSSTLNPSDLSMAAEVNDPNYYLMSLPGSFPVTKDQDPSFSMPNTSTLNMSNQPQNSQYSSSMEPPNMTQDAEMYGLSSYLPPESNPEFSDGSIQHRYGDALPLFSDMDYAPDDFDPNLFFGGT